MSAAEGGCMSGVCGVGRVKELHSQGTRRVIVFIMSFFHSCESSALSVSHSQARKKAAISTADFIYGFLKSVTIIVQNNAAQNCCSAMGSRAITFCIAQGAAPLV